MPDKPAVAVDVAIVKAPSPDVPGAVLRRFSDAKLGESIDKALATIPADRTGAVVLVGSPSGARLVAAAKIGRHWSVVMATEYNLGSRRLDAEAAVRFSW